jgi:predicted lipoprotein with Yx(FWY)xxD motif
MNRKRSITSLASAAVIPLTALVIAGCGGGATASPPPPKSANTGAATVVVSTTGLGKTLVDSRGRTLYLFEKDSGTRSTCAGACASAWPPLRANGTPTAGDEASASMLGTSKRSDGTKQVTYKGHPLYRYVGDRKAGDTNGHDVTAFGAEWYALSPGGDRLYGDTSKGSDSSDTGEPSTSGYGGY